jgi:type II secretory pathway predicted ATPase ExeA
MYETYFGMKLNPFKKDIDIKNTYEFKDFKEVQSRLKYLLNNKGIGLFTGTSGKGKTYSIKYFVKNLNPNLYKVVYLSLSTVTVLEFYKNFCIGLGIEPASKKVDMYHQIQERLKTLVKDRRITPIIICDEAQYLKTDVLNDLKMLLNFEMDSKDYAVLILVGQPTLNDILSRTVHEALNQRIIVNYMFIGIDFEEVKQYIIDRCNLAEISNEIFDENAIKALSSNCNGSTRYLNNLIDKALMICCNQKKQNVTTDTIMLATNDLSLI